MLDVMIYVHPMGCEDLDTLHMTLKGIKAESTQRSAVLQQSKFSVAAV